VSSTDDLDYLEEEVSAFLEIANIDEQPSFALAARRSNSSDPISPEQVAWLAHVRTIARGRSAPQRDFQGASSTVPSPFSPTEHR
jgi:HTH-type transcriptional regulator/antitoxin HigA